MSSFMKLFQLSLGGCLLAMFCVGNIAMAQEPKPKIITSESPKIADLIIDSKIPTVQMNKVEFDPEKESLSEILEKLQMIIKVTGRYTKAKKGWSLLLKDKALELKDDGSFEINFLMKDKTLFVDLTAVSEEGAIENEKIGVEIENFEAFSTALKTKKSPHFWSIQSGLFNTVYSQQNVSEVSQKALALGFQYRLNLEPDLFYLEVKTDSWIPASKAEPDFGKLVFWEGEAKIIYRLPYTPPDASTWQAKIGGGFFVKSMFVSPNRFGYSMSGGVLAEPEIQYPFFENNFVTAKLALGFVTSNFNPIYSFGQQYRRLRIGWIYALGEKERIFAEIFMSQFSLNKAKVSEFTNGVSAGYQFP
jgi:hypothetical protein